MHIIVDLLPVRKDGSAGGAVGFAICFINNMAERDGISITVICKQESEGFLKRALRERVSIKSVISSRIYGKIFRLRKTGDILFCPFGSILFYNKRVPVISAVLDIQHEFYPQFFSEQELEHRRKFYCRIVEKAAAVVCISNYTKSTFCEKYSYPYEDAYTIYIPVPEYPNKQSAILERCGLKKENFFLYSANFWKHKNHLRLLEAYGKFVSAYGKAYKLVLTGNPLNDNSIEEKIKEMGLSDCVVMTGYIEDQDIKELIDNAKGIIYPSLFEGFGIPVIEAMAANKLIACSNVTCLPEIGTDKIYYFDPEKIDEIESGIRFLAENRIDKSIMESYKEKLVLYGGHEITNQYLSLFKEIINRKGSDSHR